MKKFYYLVPVIGLAIFSFFYIQHMDVVKQKEEARVAEEQRVKAEEEAQKAAARKKAEEDAAKRTAEREAEEAKKLADKEAKHKEEVAKIEAVIAEFTDEFNKHLKQTRANENRLAELRKEREELRRASYDLAKQVALAQIERRNAELEIQRYAEMVVKKADQSALAAATPAPAAK